MILRSNARNQRPHASGATVDVAARSVVISPPKMLKRPASPARGSPVAFQKSKKLKLQASYTAQSPFPEYPHPTSSEALEVYNLLTAAHRPNAPVVRQPPQATSNSAQTCGRVPNVIEAVIGTILSQNTSGANCARAKKGLDEAFGRNNFEGIVNAPKEKVVDAIRVGGLANKKAGMIQNLLKAIKEKHGVYSLQHLAGEPRTPDDTPIIMSDEEIMQELLSYDGVGPKTASCVLLFCLERDSFAVDTHVYRLSRLLGWVPATADRVLAQAHLDLRIPAGLKYGLHVLMVQHGRACKGCKKPGSGESCVLKTYLREKRIKTEEDFDQKLEEVNREMGVKEEEKE